MQPNNPGRGLAYRDLMDGIIGLVEHDDKRSLISSPCGYPGLVMIFRRRQWTGGAGVIVGMWASRYVIIGVCTYIHTYARIADAA